MELHDPPSMQRRDVKVIYERRLSESTDFWPAVDATNAELADSGLYITHFFGEDQVVLRPNWREDRVRLTSTCTHLVLYRLGDIDLLLSKLMRDDPIDQSDAMFIVRQSGMSRHALAQGLAAARLPDSPEVREQFEKASSRLLRRLAGASTGP